MSYTIKIKIDNPEKKYQAGETISGNVIIDAKEDYKFKSIKVTYQWLTHGKGDVSKGDIVRTKIFSGELTAGISTLPFALKLPKHIPNTHHGEILSINHYLEAHPTTVQASIIDPVDKTTFLVDTTYENISIYFFKHSISQPNDEYETMTAGLKLVGFILLVITFFLLRPFYLATQPIIAEYGFKFIALEKALESYTPIFLQKTLWALALFFLLMLWLFRKTIIWKKDSQKYGALGTLDLQLKHEKVAVETSVSNQLICIFSITPTKNIHIEKITLSLRQVEEARYSDSDNRTSTKFYIYDATEEHTMVQEQSLIANKKVSFETRVTLPNNGFVGLNKSSNRLYWQARVIINEKNVRYCVSDDLDVASA